ncbi:hypothetical protein B2J93_597 [Marssonina coronariae]|uniref:Uncharacterized protein n=1 Tax=Diplocarpon coronariae TaxID=2795749 RepID=A0A218ZAH8_9HELO|nr:hypothetical protein B2J93_597 [Marssonina coronariae]
MEPSPAGPRCRKPPRTPSSSSLGFAKNVKLSAPDSSSLLGADAQRTYVHGWITARLSVRGTAAAPAYLVRATRESGPSSLQVQHEADIPGFGCVDNEIQTIAVSSGLQFRKPPIRLRIILAAPSAQLDLGESVINNARRLAVGVFTAPSDSA